MQTLLFSQNMQCITINEIHNVSILSNTGDSDGNNKCKCKFTEYLLSTP